MIAEDNEPTARLIQEVLNEAPGHGAVTVSDGRKAFAVIPAVYPGLVILDVDLPGLGGLALYDRRRARPATAAIPALFMGAAVRVAEPAGRGIRDSLRRPCDRDGLLARVHAIFAEHPPPH